MRMPCRRFCKRTPGQARSLPNAGVNTQLHAPVASGPVLMDNETRWRELTAELEAAEAELRRAQPPEGALATPEVLERFEAAKRRRYQVQFALLDFLDSLDDLRS